MNLTRAQLFAILKSLPLIRFALMLGGGLVATISVTHVQLWLLGGSGFPNESAVWLARIQGAIVLGLAGWAIVAIVMVTLAFGRAGRLAVKAPGGLEVDIDFDKPDPSEGEGPAS